jgi:hypothetical protein
MLIFDFVFFSGFFGMALHVEYLSVFSHPYRSAKFKKCPSGDGILGHQFDKRLAPCRKEK